MNSLFFASAAAMGIATAAVAQKAPDPADPKASVPPLAYESALVGYRPSREDAPASWRQVNEEVKGSAGHAGHGAAKSAPQAAPPPAVKAPTAPSAVPVPEKPAEHRH